MSEPIFAQIAARLRLYFDGLYYGDSKRLAEIFHPEARYVNTTDPEHPVLAMPEYFEWVDRRDKPVDRNEPRDGAIVAISLAGPRAAVATVTCTMGARAYTDQLSMVCLDGTWRIMAKVFHYIPAPQPA